VTGRVAHIWRHPIKSHGHEALDSVSVTAGRTLPWDRTWAIRHEAAKADGTEWAPCVNFSRGAKAPALMAITATLHEATAEITLRHPERPDLTFAPDDVDQTSAFLDWVRPLMPADRAASAGIVRVEGRGMTDSAYPSISLAGLSSLRALSDKMGQKLDPRRFRANFWIEGFGPFEEFEWIGKNIRIGTATFRVEERIQRCLATSANPDTGQRDADTLGALENGWDHRDFGIYLSATGAGDVAVGDTLEGPL
jgi:hypothetical protein